MNYVFLDVDGVLNNKNHYKRQHKKYGGRYCCENMPFNPRSLRNLQKIIMKTDAKIILTSSWRHSENAMRVLEARLIEYGLKVSDKTGIDKDLKRGMEIRTYLRENIEIETIYADNQVIECRLPKYDSFIIIDDEVKDIKNYFGDAYVVHTDWRKRSNIF